MGQRVGQLPNLGRRHMCVTTIFSDRDGNAAATSPRGWQLNTFFYCSQESKLPQRRNDDGASLARGARHIRGAIFADRGRNGANSEFATSSLQRQKFERRGRKIQCH